MTFPLVLVVSLASQGFHGWAALVWAALLYGPILLLTVLVHELGHSLAARRLGGEVDSILLWPLGGLAYIAHSGNPRGVTPPPRIGESPTGCMRASFDHPHPQDDATLQTTC